MELAQIRAANPDAVSEAARQLRRLKDRLSDVESDVQARVRQVLQREWQGPAASAADERLAATARQAVAELDQLETLGRQLMRFADGIAEAQDLVRQADRLASGADLTIKSSGAVEFPGTFIVSDDDEREALTHAAREVAALLQRAVDTASQADTGCAQSLLPNGSILSDGPAQTYDEGGGDGFWDRARDTVGGWFEVDFDNSIVGEWWQDFNEGDRSLLERLFIDPDGPLDIFGDMNAADSAVVEEVLGGTVEEIFGEDVVDRVHEEGLGSLPDAMWDDFYEGVTSIDDKVSDGLEDLVDDPVGTIAGAFGL
ncbi:MAG TPA: WXG100 family type VII secretion target [Candidatus Limnocylindrales bacterium]|nr:WXG100 family type VII secretion target [Candidatus Limnocylindrales bacterium]